MPDSARNHVAEDAGLFLDTIFTIHELRRPAAMAFSPYQASDNRRRPRDVAFDITKRIYRSKCDSTICVRREDRHLNSPALTQTIKLFNVAYVAAFVAWVCFAAGIFWP
jgi:hypothetical protein